MASIDLCVFGTPHGFDSYGVPAAMGEYCEQFYRTNRRGRMLMANRRNDGTTIYSFLVYNLIETDLRQHSFFGTSFTLRGNQYIPDLRSLYALFNNGFEWLVESGQLLTPTDSTFKYIVGKFNTVEPLLDEYFRQLMSGLSNFETEYYTSDFIQNNTGQIAIRNIDIPTRELTDVFKKTQWLAVSPLFQKEEAKGGPAGDPRRNPMAINIPDIKAQYTFLLERMTTLAINKDETDIGELNDMMRYCVDERSLMNEYFKYGDPDEKEKIDITDLSDKLGKLHDNIATLISQISRHDGPVIKPEIPGGGKKIKKVKVCAKCGKKKPASEFQQDSDICYSCAKPSGFTDIMEFLHRNSNIMAIAAVVLAVGVLALIIFGGEEQPPVPPPDDPKGEVVVKENEDAQFAEALNACDFDRANQLAKGEFGKEEKVREKFFDAARQVILSASDGDSEWTWRNFCDTHYNYSNRIEIRNRPEYTAMQTMAEELDAIASALNVSELPVQDKNRLRDRINRLDDTYSAKKQSFFSKLATIRDKRTTSGSNNGNTVNVSEERSVAVTPANIQVFETSGDYVNILKTLSLDSKFVLRTHYKLISDQPVILLEYPDKTVNAIKRGETIIGFSFHSNRVTGVIKFETGGKTYKINIERP